MSFLSASEVDAGPDTQDKAGGRVVLWLLLALLVVFGGLYVAAHYAAGDKVPRGTTVSGVSIGGHPQAEAADRLQAGLADQVSAPVEATVDGTPVTVEATEAGLAVDYEASVAEAGGEESWDPVRLWNYFTGGDDLEAVVTVDEAALGRPGHPPRRRARPHPARGGAGLRGRPASPRPRRGPAARSTPPRPATPSPAPGSTAATAELELVEQQPEIDAGDLAEARQSFANAAVSGPVTLAFEQSTVRLQPADYTPALSMEPVDGELVPRLDEQALATMLEGKVAVDGAPVDATVALVGGRPQVVPAKPGVTYDEQQITDAFLELVAGVRRPAHPGGRRHRSRGRTSPPRTPGPCRSRSRSRRFTTYYPYAEYRNVNIGRAAELVDGTVLKPGETF